MPIGKNGLAALTRGLGPALPAAGSTVARSLLSQARDRVGSKAILWLFERGASVCAARSRGARMARAEAVRH